MQMTMAEKNYDIRRVHSPRLSPLLPGLATWISHCRGIGPIHNCVLTARNAVANDSGCACGIQSYRRSTAGIPVFGGSATRACAGALLRLRLHHVVILPAVNAAAVHNQFCMLLNQLVVKAVMVGHHQHAVIMRRRFQP